MGDCLGAVSGGIVDKVSTTWVKNHIYSLKHRPIHLLLNNSIS